MKDKKQKESKEQEVKKEDLFEVKYMNRFQLAWRVLRRHKLGMVSLVVLIILYAIAIFADFLSPLDPYQMEQQYSYAPPSTIRWRDEDGNLTWPYIYDMILARDPATYRTTFHEGTSLEAITAVDLASGEELSFRRGIDGVQDIYLTFETIQFAADAEGNEVLLSRRPSYKNSQTFRIDELEALLGPYRTETEARAALATLTSDAYPQLADIGPPVKLVTEVRLHRVFAVMKPEIREVIVESMEIINEVLDDFEMELDEAIFFLEELGIDPDILDVIVNPSVVDYETRKYEIKFFIRSWEYKLLWLIPCDIHLFGTEAPSRLNLFGADIYGRDMLSRILFGMRIALSIGFVGIAISFVIGLSMGGLAGYFGGWADETLMRITEILMSIPSFYLLVSLRAILPTGLAPHWTYMLIVVILSFIGWPGMARVIRGMMLSMKETEFVQAAQAMGYPTGRIIWKHMIPNTATYIIVSITLSIPAYILGEAGLSFLGLGINEPSASWGLMLVQAQNIRAMTEAPWLLLPGLFIFIVVMAFNLFGDAIRDALDPRSLGF
ncbi:MAG TPA: ABC transporter permease [Kosmotogaceae bacterium]|nr:MAG: Binding-protein-dependent transport systems inner membrane component [Thermotogales bacterium 46_20]HAA86533.1 ABC transporter permease [Kosmotogaceae bacterium]